MRKVTTEGYAIVGAEGRLYVGWRYRRAEMIAEHVFDVRRPSEPEVSQFVMGGKLDPDQRAIWKRCRRSGDRAVKVSIKVIS